MEDKEKQAEKLAEFIHFGKKRSNGEDFVEHPKRVARAIKELGYDTDMVCASFLHHTEDFALLGEMFRIIDEIFGYRVYGLVLALTNVPKSRTYNDYVYNIADVSDDALAIKWQDIIDDTNGKVHKRQLEKYRNACLFLQSKGIKVHDMLIERLKI